MAEKQRAHERLLIKTFQVVLASGEVVLAKRDDTATLDLWDALRGGSTNFGIVTAVEMSCFPHPTSFHGGTGFYLPWARRATIQAFYDLASAPVPGEGKPISHSMWCITHLQYVPIKLISTLSSTTGSPKEEDVRALTSAWGRIPFTGSLSPSSHGQFVERMGKLAPQEGNR